jgi:transcriptional regulator with XRE-family HTH domain
MRCYLSRVENGHTVPSLDTLAKIAKAMEVQLVQFFAEEAKDNSNTPQLSAEEVNFLSQVRRHANGLTDSDRKLVVAMVKKLGGTLSEGTKPLET